MALEINGLFTTLREVNLDNPELFADHGGAELDPFTGVSTGQTARQIIAAQAATHGWPLIGVYVSTVGTPYHLAMHRSQFSPQTGSPSQRADKLSAALDAAFELVLKQSYTVTDPADPDFGQTIEVRKFFLKAHVWTYRADGLYTPRISSLGGGGTGDYGIFASATNPPGNWWVNR